MQPNTRRKSVVRKVVCDAHKYGRCGGSSCEFSLGVSQSLARARNLGHIHKQFRIRTLPIQQSTRTRILPRHPPMRPTSHPAPEDVENVLHGMRLLREFDEEARALSALRSELSTTAKQLFECSICMDKMPADSFARIDTCGHTFCRECLRGHVTARLEEHRFPILCPTCTTNRGKGKKKAGGTCRLQMVVAVAADSAPWLPFRGFAVPSLKPRTHRRTIQSLDGNGNGFVLHSPTVQKVRPWCSSPHFLCQPGTGASGRCSSPETNMMRQTLSSVPFRTANTHGANSVNSRSTSVGRNTHAMVRQNWTF
jgi:hypothetical protein